MVKLGLVGGAKANHGINFSRMINNNEVAREARITSIWDCEKEHAREIADLAGIGHVCDKPEDMLGLVDGVLIIDDLTLNHQKRAKLFLSEGVPTFIDKPIAPDIREAEELFELAAAKKAPLMSCSALRFAAETEPFRQNGIGGEFFAGCSVGPSMPGLSDSLIFYGIHAVELLLSVVGGGVKGVRYHGSKHEGTFLLDLGDRVFTVFIHTKAKGFHLSLYGPNGNAAISITNSDMFYKNMLKSVVDMISTGVSPISAEETLEIIRIFQLN